MSSVIEQDVVIYLTLLCVIFLYRFQFRLNSNRTPNHRIVNFWTWGGFVFATYFMAVGVSYQYSIIGSVPAYVLFGIGVALLLLCLRTLRVKMRAAKQGRVLNTDTEGK